MKLSVWRILRTLLYFCGIILILIGGSEVTPNFKYIIPGSSLVLIAIIITFYEGGIGK